MAYRSKLAVRKTKSPNPYFILALFGVFSISYATYLKYSERVLSFTQEPQEALITKTNKEDLVPILIQIEKLGINIPIKKSKINNGTWEISDDSASFLETSAIPGQNGNIVIYAHNKKTLFGPLADAKKGDLIKLSIRTGRVYDYEVSEVFSVTPDKIDVVSPTDFEVLTIYTCTSIFDTKRLIVKALPKNE